MRLDWIKETYWVELGWLIIAEDVLQTFGVECEHNGVLGEHFDRYVRVVGNSTCPVVQVSDKVDVFDKWSNSVAKEFDLSVKEDRKSFVDFVEFGKIEE